MKLEDFVRPLYQDAFDDVERIGRIARQLHPPSRRLDLLILFSGLGKWLEKPRNLSRILLAAEGITDAELREVAASLRRLDDPQAEVERAVAAAKVIDAAGVRGLAERLTHARREGISIADVAREEPTPIPDWMPALGRELMMERQEERARVCAAILEEL